MVAPVNHLNVGNPNYTPGAMIDAISVGVSPSKKRGLSCFTSVTVGSILPGSQWSVHTVPFILLEDATNAPASPSVDPRHVAPRYPVCDRRASIPASGLVVASETASRDCRYGYVRFWGVLIRSARCQSDLLLASSATNSPIADAPYHALHHGRQRPDVPSQHSR
jgi:hypothetical protein